MLSRSRSRFLLVCMSFLVVAAVSSGCMKKKPKAELRLPDTGGISSLNGKGVPGSQWNADGSAPGMNSLAGGGSMTPGEGGFGANGANGAGAAGTMDAGAGTLANSADTTNVDQGVLTSELEMIHFEYDSAQISPEWQTVLDGHATWINSNTKVMVQVEGHCDDRGTEEYNISLGQRRADEVRNYLASKGVDPNRVSTISYGELRPLNFDGTEEAQSLNRRAMFLVYQANDSVAAAAPAADASATTASATGY